MPTKTSKVTIYDVAQAADVSISTVSHVLNNTRYVADETKQRVWRAVDQLNYRPNSLARALVRQETRTIALIIPDNANPFFAELASGIEAYGFEAGYNVLFCNTARDKAKEAAHLDLLIAKRVDGIIFLTGGADNAQLQTLLEHRIALVTFDRKYPDIDAILLDNWRGGYTATQHLIELGHQCIACITGPDSPSRSCARVDGYCTALTDSGYPIVSEFIVPGNWTYASGKHAAEALFALDSPPTAIFACNDVMAVGAINYLSEAGLHVPHDVSVVGFDNITLSAFMNPPLTTFSTALLQVGHTLCQVLLDRIGGALPDEAQRVHVPGELIVRQSTALLE